MRNNLRRSAAVAALAATLGAPTLAHAEADVFGVGNGHAGALNVTGTQIVNSYAGLTQDAAAGATSLAISAVIGAPGGFAAGDLVLVWRATGVVASEAPSGQTKKVDLATALSTTSTPNTNVAGLTGTYEFARVATAAAGTLTLTAPLVHGFTRFVSQVVKVPEYTTVNVSSGATLLATAWQEVNGTPAAPNPNAPWAGGIVVFLAQGTVTNAGTIHANARGFHGALPPQRFISTVGLVNCDRTSVDGNSTSSNYGQKGEGIIHALYLAASGGKGNLSNAGGGGQCVEGGGGGGANGGNGGVGSASALNLGVGGYPGIAVDFDIATHLTMGGGGGAGRQIATGLSSVSFGGFGGGVVFVRANAMSGAGKLQANGGRGEDSGLVGLPSGVASEGSGGGGAGGTIVVRILGALDCDSIASPGGNGGNAVVAGVPVFGSGGGGGGGRVSFVAAQKAETCKIIVTPGRNGGTGSDPGLPGTTEPSTDSMCDAPYGAGTATSCPDPSRPVCAAGMCLPCDGNFGSGTRSACQRSELALCNTKAGTCGKGCLVDGDCASVEWCAPVLGASGGICTPKTPNKNPLPPYPPIDGTCTVPNGQRVCLSSVCEPNDDLCGYINDRECPGGAGQCRSEICFTDGRCGYPNGHFCSLSPQCRSNVCDDGTCRGCTTDPECSADQVCNAASQTCVPGCRVGVANTATDGGVSQGACKAPARCIAPDGGAIGTCQTEGDTDGIIEGGGCACNTTPSRSASPFAFLGAVSAALVAWRRRKRSGAASSTRAQG